jgi:nucleoside-diphosphate kinase
MKDLYKGSDINIFSRKHKLIEYGDEYTKEYFEKVRSNTFGMIKPDGYLNIGKIIDMIYNVGGFTITKLKLCRMSLDDAAEFYAEHKGKPFMIF